VAYIRLEKDQQALRHFYLSTVNSGRAATEEQRWYLLLSKTLLSFKCGITDNKWKRRSLTPNNYIV